MINPNPYEPPPEVELIPRTHWAVRRIDWVDVGRLGLGIALIFAGLVASVASPLLGFGVAALVGTSWLIQGLRSQKH